ncbi:MAG: exodeoxyribonuclease VII small subunit [Flavihumibacter sp.]
MDPHLTYEAAFDELQELANSIENEHIGIDLLAEKLKRAAELIEFCQARLRFTELEVNKITGRLENDRE